MSTSQFVPLLSDRVQVSESRAGLILPTVPFFASVKSPTVVSAQLVVTHLSCLQVQSLFHLWGFCCFSPLERSQCHRYHPSDWSDWIKTWDMCWCSELTLVAGVLRRRWGRTTTSLCVCNTIFCKAFTPVYTEAFAQPLPTSIGPTCTRVKLP